MRHRALGPCVVRAIPAAQYYRFSAGRDKLKSFPAAYPAVPVYPLAAPAIKPEVNPAANHDIIPRLFPCPAFLRPGGKNRRLRL